MTQSPLNTPWTLHFDRDGTEDIAVIRDGDGEDLVTSRHFWLPEGDDPVPPTLAAMQVMAAAPNLLLQLMLLVDHIETPNNGAGLDAALRRLRIQEARATIAQAHGRAA